MKVNPSLASDFFNSLNLRNCRGVIKSMSCEFNDDKFIKDELVTKKIEQTDLNQNYLLHNIKTKTTGQL